MIQDLGTVIWKEWKEYFNRDGGRMSGLRLLIALAVVGGILPAQIGRAWLSSPLAVAMASWMPIILVVAVIADSFAGERERHTLESLLATRLPDRSILFGKILAAVAYGWGLALAMMLLPLIVLNLMIGGSGPRFYAPEVALAALGFSLLAAVLASCAGVLVSLWAATVRQAQQTLSIASMLLVFIPAFGIPALPASIRLAAAKWLLGAGRTTLILILGGGLLLVDAVLVAAVMARFRRDRLILQ